MTKKPPKPANKPAAKRKKTDIKSKSVVNRRNKKNAKPRAIDIHPDKKEIIARILKGESLAAIERAYGLGKGVAWKYVQEVLAERVQEVMVKQGDDLEAQLRRIMAPVEKLVRACDEYLQDPNNPDKYDLNPRSWEIDITYRTWDDSADDEGETLAGKQRRPARPIMRKESLQRILERMDECRLEPWEVKYKYADPRKLLIEASNSLRSALEVIAKILGKIKEPGGEGGSVTINQYVVNVRALIVKALDKYPEARAAVIEELSRGQ